MKRGDPTKLCPICVKNPQRAHAASCSVECGKEVRKNRLRDLMASPPRWKSKDCEKVFGKMMKGKG